KMAEVGILKEEDKVELLNGEIIKMSPIGSLHAGYLYIIDELLGDALGKKVHINNQSAIRLGPFSEPEPDVTVLKRRRDYYLTRLPRPQDAYLIVEVADSSLEKDRTYKAPLYAKAEIPEYWILNIAHKQIEVFRQPKNGVYQEQIVKKINEEVTFLAFDVTIKLSDVFIMGDL
ncbi:MAG: Uma2 family endonuclease, partial [Bacteroidota bacterium]